MQDPQTISSAGSFDAWKCPKRPKACNIPKRCALTFDEDIYGGIRYMPICNKCPAKYPWIGNYDGSYRKQYIYEEVFGTDDDRLTNEDEDEDESVNTVEEVNQN